jgi:hypothetical protein
MSSYSRCILALAENQPMLSRLYLSGNELIDKVIIISRELDPFQGNGSFYFVLREIQTMIYEKSHFS